MVARNGYLDRMAIGSALETEIGALTATVGHDGGTEHEHQLRDVQASLLPPRSACRRCGRRCRVDRG